MIFTLLALLGAAAASYTDIKEGVIPNRLTFSLFAAGVAGHLLLDGREIAAPLFTGILLIFIAGYGFWALGGWSAGDAKEFLFLAALLPLYPQWLKGYFTPVLAPYPFVITIFLNTFLAIFPFIFLYSLYASITRARLRDFLRPLQDIRETGVNALVFAAAILLSRLLGVSAVFAIPLIIFSYWLEMRVKTLLALLTCAGYIYYTGEALFAAGYVLEIFAAIILFRLFWNSIGILREEALHRTVRIEDIEEGMVPAEEIYIGKDKIDNKARGLVKEEIEMLKEMHRQGRLTEIRVKKTAPFAPVILAGLLISLTVGDLIMVISHG